MTALPNFRGFARVTMYVVEVLEGSGTADDVYRLVRHYMNEDGSEVFKLDPADSASESLREHLAGLQSSPTETS